MVCLTDRFLMRDFIDDVKTNQSINDILVWDLKAKSIREASFNLGEGLEQLVEYKTFGNISMFRTGAYSQG